MLNNKGHRYVIETQTWVDQKSGFKVFYEYADTLDEAKQLVELIQSVYSSIPKPEKIEETVWGKLITPNGATYWGYVLLDFETTDIIDVGGDGLHHYTLKDIKNNINYTKWKLQDLYFRKPGEIPPGYVFSEGEREGWYRFRWGDGGNALSKVVPVESKKKKPKWYQNNIPVEDENDDF